MDPRPGPGDPLAGVEADLDALDSAPAQDRVAIYGRIHNGLAAALSAAAGDAGQQGPRPPHQRGR